MVTLADSHHRRAIVEDIGIDLRPNSPAALTPFDRGWL
jgi:hypothetical protein